MLLVQILKIFYTILYLMVTSLYLYSNVTIKTGEVNLQYTGFFNSGNYYSEKDVVLQNNSLFRGSIDNLNVSGKIYKDIFFNSIFNIDLNNPEALNFRYNRMSLLIFNNLFLVGSLPLNFSSVINNTNNIYGVMWQTPILPEKQLNAAIFGAQIKEGFDSPFYPTYVYGVRLSSEIKKIKLSTYYCKITEEEESLRYNSILQPNFALTANTINKLTAQHSKGTIRKTITFDMDTDPYLEISIVDTGDKNIEWELEVDNGSERITIQYITKQSGIFKYNLKAPTGWTGSQQITIYLNFYNSPYDLSDNNLYVDYVKIYNSSGILFNFEDFSTWIIPEDVVWTVLNKDDVITSLPDSYFPFKSQMYGFSIKKNKGYVKGMVDVSLNETKPSPIEIQRGYFIKSKIGYLKKKVSASLSYDKISQDFNVGPLYNISEPKIDLKDDTYFFLSPTSFFGNWVQKYVKIISMPDCIKLIGEGGEIYKYFEVDLDKYPVLSIKVGGNVNENFEWALYVEDDNSSFLLDYSSKTGIFNYNIKDATGWTGKKKFRIRIKKGKENLYLYWLKFWKCEVSKKYVYGQDSQLLNFNFSYQLLKKLKTSFLLKLWNNNFANYNCLINCSYDLIKNQKILLQLKGGVNKNKGYELKEVWELPRLIDYFGVNTKCVFKYKSDNIKISDSFLQYTLDKGQEQNVSLITYNFGIKYLFVVWWGYSIKGNNGKIVDTIFKDYKQYYTIEKDIPISLTTDFIFQYIFSKYINIKNNEFNYDTNLFKIKLEKREGHFLSILTLQYNIGNFGKFTSYKYNNYRVDLQVRVTL